MLAVEGGGKRRQGPGLDETHGTYATYEGLLRPAC